MVETIWVDGPHCSMTPQNPRLYAAPCQYGGTLGWHGGTALA